MSVYMLLARNRSHGKYDVMLLVSPSLEMHFESEVLHLPCCHAASKSFSGTLSASSHGYSRALSCTSYHIISCHVMSCHVMSCHIISYRIISCTYTYSQQTCISYMYI